MIYYLNLYKALIVLNFSALIVFKTNFFNSIFSSLLWGGFQVLSIIFLTNKTEGSYGWTSGELIFLVLIYNLILGFFHLFFSKNFERLSQLVNLGQLDSILVKPADSQFLVSFWLINFSSFARVILTLSLLPILVSAYKINVNYFLFVFFLILLPVGLLLLYSVWSIIMTLVIYFPRLSNLVELMFTINGQGRFPKEMYTSAKNLILYIFVPVSLVATTPAKVLLNKFSSLDLVELFIFAFSLFLISRLFWKFALRSYTSASS